MLKKSLIYLLSFLIIGSLLGGFGVWFYGTLSLPKTKGSIKIQGISSSVKIIRDAAGIPHIFASTDQDAFFALGYVHSQDRFWQMEMHRRIGAGRLSEIFGEKTLKTDQFLRTLGVYRTASKAWEHLSPPTQKNVRILCCRNQRLACSRTCTSPGIRIDGFRTQTLESD